MRVHNFLSCALLACLATLVVAGSDDYKRKGECLAAALVGYAIYAPQDDACAAATTKAACLATTGFVLTDTPTTRRASCSWRETNYAGDLKDEHVLYRSDSAAPVGALFAVLDFNSFCSLETEISVPKALKNKMFADVNIQYGLTFGGSSACVAGAPRGRDSCEVGPLVDPGLALGLPRAFDVVKQFIGLWAIDPTATFERSVFVTNVFRVNCRESYKGRRLTDSSKGSGNWYKYLNTEQTTIGLPPSDIFGVFGNWRDVFTTRGFIYEFILPSNIGGGARAEVEVLKGSSPVPVVALIVDLKAVDDYKTANCDTMACPAPVHLALASCYPRKKCKMTVPSFPPTVGNANYGLMVSRLMISAASNPYTDGLSVNLSYKLDLQVDPAGFAGITSTAVGATTASAGAINQPMSITVIE